MSIYGDNGVPPRPLALTMGEPAGIGGEIALKAWMRRERDDIPAFFMIDDPARLSALARRLEWPVTVETIDTVDDCFGAFSHGIPVLPRPLPCQPMPGTPNPEHAPAIIGSIDQAVEFVQTGEASAVVTNPIHKLTLTEAGFRHNGHTEYLAELAGGGARAVMMLACDTLRVVPLSVHVSLQESITSLTQDRIMDVARLTIAALRSDFGIAEPHVVVAGLNPHAGEGGTMGREEIEIIAPAIEELKKSGLSVRGPAPADTLFHDRARTGYDAAICMYHDQALIPIKTVDFHGAVNVTLGLPFVRTSPDHGTAFEIAGAGIADETSLIASLKMAARMATRRQAAQPEPAK